MFLKRILKAPDLGPWVTVAELTAALLTVTATLMALNVVPSPFKGAPGGKVSGMVTDAKTGKPVPEATVQIVDPTSAVIAGEPVPNAQGKWSETVKAGSYTVKATCDGYAPAAKTVSVVASKERIVNLCIKPETKAEEQAREAAAAPQPAAAPKIIVVAPAAGGGHSSGPSSGAAENSDAARAQAEYQRGVKLKKNKNNNGALDAFSKAAQLDPTDGRYHAAVILVDMEQGNYADAKQWAKDADKLVTKNRAIFEQAKGQTE